MATTKTIRLRSDNAAWLAAEKERTGLSENWIIQALIDQARRDGWTPPMFTTANGDLP